jgi:hypothetical protein
MEDPSYLDKILDKKIAGQEDDVILFFDEGAQWWKPGRKGWIVTGTPKNKNTR